MLNRSTIFFGLMLTGSLAVASLMREEKSHSSQVVLPAPRALSHKLNDAKPAAFSALRLDKIARAKLLEPEHNPFAGKSWYVPPPPPPLVITDHKEVERLFPPIVPFRYMGRVQEEGERPVVFFMQGTQAYSVSEGEDLDGSYRLESVSPTHVVLLYLPLNTRQTVNIGSFEMEPEADVKDASTASANQSLPVTVMGRNAESWQQ